MQTISAPGALTIEVNGGARVGDVGAGRVIDMTPFRRSVTTAVASDAVESARIVIEVEERYGQALLGFARRTGLDAEQADDAVQEVLVRLFRTLRDGVAVNDPRAWAFRYIYRIAIDEHRLARRVSLLRERLMRRRDGPHEPEPDHATRLSIWSEVDRLPNRQRQVLYLRYKADLDYDDIANVMRISAAGARAIAARGIAAMRQVIDREDVR